MYEISSNKLTLKLTLSLTDPVTPYFIRPLLNKLVKGSSSLAEFVGRALPDLELFFQQFLCMLM